MTPRSTSPDRTPDEMRQLIELVEILLRNRPGAA